MPLIIFFLLSFCSSTLWVRWATIVAFPVQYDEQAHFKFRALGILGIPHITWFSLILELEVPKWLNEEFPDIWWRFWEISGHFFIISSPKWVIVRWVMKKIMILINKETTQMNNLLMLTMIIEILVSFSTVSFCFYLIHYYSYWLNCSEGFWRGWGKMEIGYGWVAIVC